MANELALMLARKRQFDTETDVLRQKDAQLREQIIGLRGQAEGLERQHSLLEQEAQGARQLHASGYATKTRILALERDLAKLQAEAGLRRADIARAEQAIAQVTLEIAKVERARLSEITDQLRTSQSRLAELRPRIDAAQDVVDRTVIAAPASGAVVGLTVFTEGGVVQAGAKLLDIVPRDNPLMVEARLRIDDVNQVAPGKRADVRLTSIHHSERPRISGEVVTVSADRLTDERSGQPYYAVQVRLDPGDVAKARMELQAGMQAEVIVTTRARTLIGYLVGPLADEVTGAFREK
jgi:HlyD family type I secretion membrane fusion protein